MPQLPCRSHAARQAGQLALLQQGQLRLPATHPAPPCRRGFTTVRDAGGADWGLAQAVEEGTVVGPRILFTGHALSQTGGHGDMRGKGEDWCACGSALRGIGRVCDGVGEVRKAARDELCRGAHCIKIMASGGVASPTDRCGVGSYASCWADAHRLCTPSPASAPALPLSYVCVSPQAHQHSVLAGRADSHC